jgi:hypothetical protein
MVLSVFEERWPDQRNCHTRFRNTLFFLAFAGLHWRFPQPFSRDIYNRAANSDAISTGPASRLRSLEGPLAEPLAEPIAARRGFA